MKIAGSFFSVILMLLFGIDSVNAADTLKVEVFRHVGPVKVQRPYMIDTVDNDGASYSVKGILDAPLLNSALKNATEVHGIPSAAEDEMHMLGFTLENSGFVKGGMQIKGLSSRKVFLDGNPLDDDSFSLDPGTHDFVVRYIGSGEEKEEPEISAIFQKGHAGFGNSASRRFSLDSNTLGESCSSVSISPSGKLVAVRHALTDSKGSVSYYTEIIRITDSRLLVRQADAVKWMQDSDGFYCSRTGVRGKDLYCVYPETMQESLVCADIPDGSYEVSPDGKYLLYTLVKEGRKEGAVHQILNPEDRQPGYRDRYYLAKYDLSTGVMQPLTFGYHNSWLADISRDGRKILFGTSSERFTQRPTTLNSLYQMDMATLDVTPVYENEGFASGGSFSPDASGIAVMGSPEAFGGIGMDLPEGRIPNMYDNQLFLIDPASGKVSPLTGNFNPSVQNFEWSSFDGKIYLLAENGDRQEIFRLDPVSAGSERLSVTEDYVYGFSLASAGRTLAFYGESLESFRKVYVMDTKSGKSDCIVDFTPLRCEGVTFGKGGSYEFTSSRGDRITCFYVLPPDFDANSSYPVIVHYYGGCSPSLRYCVGRYSPQYYAAQGYVFLVVNPSGASGFGQEFASRHVNTVGEGVAEDIIEATENFCKDHSWADPDRLGCISASYGGFMTQLLLTKTSMFRTGISHAGISDHTSYWGEGYWGYSYSEVSMAGSYPWNRKDLYVDGSPLFNADKIHTPLLFLHGSADTNVPVGESIQMFTALTLLGQDTAFVVVDGENHHINEFNKQRQWLRTISAWFAKYLKDDSSWWDELYPEKKY